MSGKALRNAISCSNCLHNVSRGASVQQRAFTNSAIRQRHGAVPSFSNSSSSELQTLFTELREKVILPAHLSEAQKKIIYEKKYQSSLANGKTTAVAAGEQFTLAHIDRLKDVPSARKTLFKAIALFKTKDDWDNLPRLLQGLKQAGVKMNGVTHAQFIRKAGKAGRHDTVLELVRKADAVGLPLDQLDTVLQIMLLMQGKALESDWDAVETKKALSWAEMVTEQLESHRSQSQHQASSPHPRNQPEVIGILLELAAVRASKHLDGKDADGKVAAYADRLLKAANSFVPVAESPATQTADHNIWLSRLIPTLHGMRIAETCLQPTSRTAELLKKKANALEQQIRSMISGVTEKPGKGKPIALMMYEKLIPQES